MEEIAEEHWLRDNTVSDNDREVYVKGFLACAENMYSEEDIKQFGLKCVLNYISNGGREEVPDLITDVTSHRNAMMLEQFKKK